MVFSFFLFQKNQDYIESILPTPPELSKEEAQDKMLQHLINKFYHWRNQYCIRETDAEYLITPMTETWEELKKKREEFLTHRLNRNTFTEKVKDQTQIHEQEAPTKIPSRPLEVIRKDLADVQRNIAELDAERAYLEEKRARAIVGGTYVPKATEVSLDMTQKVARVFLKYQPSDIFTLEALDTRYKEVSEANDSKAIQEEIDVAYQVLKAHLEQKGEYQEERRKFDFGETETITVKELTYRYKLASEQTDSKAKQKALDEAYQLLLKTAI